MTHTLSLSGMNYGGGSLIETSGEKWAFENVIRPRLDGVARPIVFDVGANVGDYAMLAKHWLPTAHVFCFEPAARTYQDLSANIAKQSHGDIQAYRLGFSDAERTADLYSYTIEGKEVSLLASLDRRLATQVVDVAVHSSETVRVQTIDSFCVAQNIDSIDLLKLDVEGHEVSVLRGARDMLKKRAISIIQFEFGPANIYSRTFFYDFWLLLSDDYKIYRIVPKGVVPIAYYGEHREIFLTTNYLAIRKPG